MKAFTDIDQSKKLADILPIKSADMCWCNNSIKGVSYTDEFSANLRTVKEVKDIFDSAFNEWDKYWKLIPCWSLAALLNILPHCIDEGYDITLGKLPDNKSWYVCYDDVDHFVYIYITKSNLIDACVEMILKLKENNLI